MVEEYKEFAAMSICSVILLLFLARDSFSARTVNATIFYDNLIKSYRIALCDGNQLDNCTES